MDIIIPHIKGHWDSIDLRYTLRSIHRWYPEHGEVYLMGHKPDWYIGKHWDTSAVPNTDEPFRTTTEMLLEAASRAELSEMFYWWDDDTLLISPYQPRYYFRETQRDRIGPYARALSRTTSQGYDFETHTPFPYRRSIVLEFIARMDKGMLPRTFYGNLHNVVKHVYQDRKFSSYQDPMPTEGIISLGDLFMGTSVAREWAERTFYEKSPWE